MQPSVIDVHAIGQLEGFTHQASFIYLQEDADIKHLQTTLLELLAEEKNIDYGITITPVNGLLIRLLGHGAEQLHKLLIKLNRQIDINRKGTETQIEKNLSASAS